MQAPAHVLVEEVMYGNARHNLTWFDWFKGTIIARQSIRDLDTERELSFTRSCTPTGHPVGLPHQTPSLASSSFRRIVLLLAS